MRSARLLVATFLCLSAQDAVAKTVYVDNMAGDDRFRGAAATTAEEPGSGPVRTIARALELASPGDTIVLAKNDEPYREGIAVVGARLSGVGASYLTIEGSGATLDGSTRVPMEAWQHYDQSIFRFHPRYVSHQQVFLDGRPSVRVFVEPTADAPPELGPLQWCLLGGYVYFRVEKFRLPADYDLRYAFERTGVTLLHADKVVIRDLTIQGFQLDGLNAFNSARDIVLDGVVCRGNGRAGVTVGPVSDVTMNACLLGDNGETQLLVRSLGRAWLQNSELLSPVASPWKNEGGEIWVDGRPAE